MNEGDVKVRKKWLMALFVYVALTLYNIIMTVAYQPTPNDSSFPYGMMVVSAIGVILYAYGMYHCAYKKPGTKFLMVILIITPIMLLGSFWSIVWNPSNETVAVLSKIPFYWPITIFSTVFMIWFLSMHWKMRTINKRLKAQ